MQINNTTLWHDTPLGSHAPPRINQLPMVSEPHDFHHIKEVEDGSKLEVFEKGEDNFNHSTSQKFQKYVGKKSVYMFKGYDHTIDMKNDDFLAGLGREEKNKFDQEMKKIWENSAKEWRPEDQWFMIMEGKKVALFQDIMEGKKAANFWTDATAPNAGWSLKSCWFEDLASAKNYIQMARDEEGVHFGWPKRIPVIWKKGPVSRNDIEWNPGFEDEVFEDEV